MSNKSNISSLEYIFNLVLNAAYVNRRKNSKFDGKGFWGPIKNLLSESPIDLQYKKIPKSLVEKMMLIPEKYINGYGNEIMIEPHHFLIQQVRIPTTEPLSLRKIIQIALNIGQWKGFPNPEIYKDIDYNNTGLDNINTYLSKTNIHKISSYIDANTVEKIENYISSI